MENVVELLSIDGNLFRPQFLPLMTLKWFVQLEQLNRTNEIYIFPGSILLCSKISAQTRTQIRYDLAQAPDTCTLSLSLSYNVISAFRFGCSHIDFGVRFLPIYGHVFRSVLAFFLINSTLICGTNWAANFFL